MSSGPKASGGRNIVAYFAGHLANLVNGNDTLEPIQDFAEIKAFANEQYSWRKVIDITQGVYSRLLSTP